MFRYWVLLFFINTFSVFAQQESLYSNYMYNTQMFNPAYTGSSSFSEIFALHRNQWIGIDGAPKNYHLSLSLPIKNTNFAVGLNFLNESIGPTNTNDISVIAAYHLPISEKYFLALGLQTSIQLFDFDKNKLNIYDPSDVRLENFNTSTQPNIGSGLYLYSSKFYFGLSVPFILQSKLYDDNNISVYQRQMNWYVISGYVFDINSNIKAKPAVLFKNVSGAPLQIDMSANFMFVEKFIFGISYRLNASWNVQTSYELSPAFTVGYSYDLQNTQLINYNSGSHELFLKYRFLNKSKKIYSPRFF